MSRMGGLVALFTLLAACDQSLPPRPQALVFVDTDLPSPALADRVRIDVLRQEAGTWVPACDGCSREVAIVSEADWPLSFGVEATDAGDARRVRATLFPVGRISAGRALPETAIESVIEVRFGDGLVSQELFLEGVCAGIPAEDEASCLGGALAPIRVAPERDPDAPSRVGTFRDEIGGPCTGTPSADSGLYDEEICVEGATYWMGDVRRQGFGGHVDAVPEHLVTVSSFFIDRHEYTVGRYRAALARGFVPSAAPPGTSGATDPGCTLPDDGADDSRDAFPLNCVRAYLAEELCAFDGRRLPTEAEREWVAGNGADETLFPWGDLRTAETSPEPGPAPVGGRDYDDVDGVFDLAWNVTEWVADDFQPYTERCWKPGNYGVDPMCVDTSEDPSHGRSIRGGYWQGSGDPIWTYRAMAPSRQVLFEGAFSTSLGFRCARDDG